MLVAQGLIDRLAIASVLARQWSVVQSEGKRSHERGQAGQAATPAREDVAALHLRIAELESVVTQLNAELARRKEQLELLGEIVSGQAGPAVYGHDPAEATQSNAADLRPFEVIPQFGLDGKPPRLGDLLVSKGSSARSSLKPWSSRRTRTSGSAWCSGRASCSGPSSRAPCQSSGESRT
jgi:hypothetical protein